MTPTLKTGLPGLFLLLCAAALLKFRLDLQPLLGTPPNPETPNLAASEIRSHLMMLGGLAGLCVSGALLSLSLAAFFRQSTPTRARLVNLSGWALRLVILGLWSLLVWSYAQTALQRGVTSGGERGFTLAALTVIGGLPLIILTWTALSRLGRWMNLHGHWDGTQPGTLQRQYRLVSGSWRLLALLLLAAGLWLLPLNLMDIPHPKANTVSTLLDKTVIAQQKPLMLSAMLALLSAAASIWFTRVALADLTATLDQTKSRIGQYLGRPTTPA